MQHIITIRKKKSKLLKLSFKKMAIMSIAFMILFSGCTTAGDADILDDASDSEVTSRYEYRKEYELSQSTVMAFGENGYYYLFRDILMFYDVNADVNMPVCSKTDCKHDSSSCDAYAANSTDYDLLDWTGVNVNCLGSMVWWDSGHIYMIRRDEAGDYLMQYDSNYMNEVKLLALAENGIRVGMPATNASGTALMYDGYMYYYSIKPVIMTELDDCNMKVYVNRIKVEKGAEAEVLGSFEFGADYYVPCAEIHAGKNNVYFVAGGLYRRKSKNDPVQYRIGCYDCSKGEFSMMLNANSDTEEDVLGEGTGNVGYISVGATCVDDEDNLYISTADKTIVKFTASGHAEVIYSPEGARNIESLTWDGKHIYMFIGYGETGKIVRIDKQGNLKGEYALTADLKYSIEYYMELYILGIDDDYIIVRTPNYNIHGLESSDIFGEGMKAVGLISKDSLDNQSEPIKCIHKK